MTAMALVVLGLGNDLLGDDTAGLLAAEQLDGRLGPQTTVRRTAQSGLYLIEHLQGFDDAIVIDTILGDRPGHVRELDASAFAPIRVPSAHDTGLPEALALARRAGLRVPSRLRIFAVEISPSQRIGAPPSPEIIAAIPEVVARVTEVAAGWGYAMPSSRPTRAGATHA